MLHMVPYTLVEQGVLEILSEFHVVHDDDDVGVMTLEIFLFSVLAEHEE